MKKIWRVVMTIIALNVALGCASGVAAQQLPIAGGYAETSSNDPEVIQAARYAIRAQARKQRARISLISIERAEVQVVAGLNYRLRLRVKVNGKTQNVAAVVYQNLKQKYSLTDYKDVATQEGNGAAAASYSTIEQLVKALAEAYTDKSLGSLDAERPYFGKVKFVIEHSLAQDNAKDRFEIKNFTNLEQGEQWLKSREREDTPARESRALRRCRKGVCTYNFEGGILHNHLYLQKITYGYRNKRPYIKTIYLLDGD